MLKKTTLLLLLLIFSKNCFGQILKSSLTNIGSNASHLGRILDVKYIPEFDIYVVAGDFTSFNGINRQNLIILDKNLEPISDLGLSSCNGPINTIEYRVINSNQITLWIGGAFDIITPVNGVSQTKNLFAEFTITTNNPGNYTAFSQALTALNPIISGYKVNDIEYIFNGVHRLIVGGDILDVSLSNMVLTPINLSGLQAFSINLGTISQVRSVIANPMLNSIVYSIEEIPNSNGAYVFSTAKNESTFVGSVSSAGNQGSFNHKSPSLLSVAHNFASPRITLNGSTIHRNDQFQFVSFEGIPANPPRHTSLQLNTSFPYVSTFQVQTNDFYPNNYQFYGDDYYSTSSFFGSNNYLPQFLSMSKINSLNQRSVFAFLGSTGNFDIDYDSTLVYKQDELIIAGRYLFYSSPNLTGVSDYLLEFGSGGLPVGRISTGVVATTNTFELESPVSLRQKLAVFCLEPKKPSAFIAPDTIACVQDTLSFSISKTQFAMGYKWTYSGNHSHLKVKSNAASLYSTLGSSFLTTDTTLFVEIQSGFNGGVLSVTPFNLCNSSDTLYSASRTIHLYSAPLPDISIPDTSKFTCAVDTLNVLISTSQGTTFNWTLNGNAIGSNANLILPNTTSGIPSVGIYAIGSTQEPINGCKSVDSTFIYFDTIGAPINPSSYNQTPALFGCADDFATLDLNIPNATISWSVLPDSSLLPNPLLLYGFDTTNVRAFVTYTTNGCTVQSDFELNYDNSTLGGTVNAILPDNIAVNGITTLTCANPTLVLNAGLVSGTGTSEWIVNGSSIGSALNLSAADSAGMTYPGMFKVYDLRTTNASNGCTQIFSIPVYFNFAKPYVYPLANQSLNCSQSSLTINHPLTGGNGITEGWLDVNNNPTTDSLLFVNAIGDYYYRVISSDNGCSTIDTVSVVLTNELMLNLPSDTLICPNQQVAITVSNINNSEPTTYQWSSGANGTTINAIGGVDNQLTVIAENQSGCIGYDTIQVAITAPVIANFISSATCTDASIEVASVVGESGPYSYSINNGPWQTTTAFNGLTYADYLMAVKDDLGCIYTFSQTIDGSAEDPDVNFLVSTYNLTGDTLAIVNISNFTGFDSLVWDLPFGSDVYSADDSMVVVSIPTGGWYDVSLIAYIDTCSYTFTKPVYFGDEKPVFNEDYSAKGIQDINLYPNPTTGIFTLEFTLGVSQNYTIAVTNLTGQPIVPMSHSGVGTTVIHTFEFPFGSVPGNYRVHIIADFDAKQESIVLTN